VGTFTIEAALLNQFSAQVPDGILKATRDLTDLARHGGDPRGNLVAAIAADGNSLGRLFHAATLRLAAARSNARADLTGQDSDEAASISAACPKRSPPRPAPRSSRPRRPRSIPAMIST
jgi:hypothetical protein